MKKITTSVIAVLIFFTAYAQTKLKTEPFSKINLSSNAKISIQPDSSWWISYDGDATLEKVANVRDSTLKIDGAAEEELIIHTPRLQEIILDGSGLVNSRSKIKQDNLHLVIDGDGKMNLDIEVQKLNAEIPGIGKMILSGSAQDANFSITGSGKIDAQQMKAINCNVNISGLGKCIVDPVDVLNATITGNGNVVYKTIPKELNKHVTGLGTVKGLDGSSESSGKPDTTKLELGKSQVWFIGEKDSTHTKKNKSVKPIWSGFELGFNSYMDNGGTFTLDPGKENFGLQVDHSQYVSLNLFQEQTEIGRSNIWLMTGLGLTWNNYRFDNNIVLDNGPYISAHHDSSDMEHIKSKLVAAYVTVPVMVEVFTSRKIKNAFHLGIGGMFGVRIASYTKRKFEIDGQVSKVHSHDDYNLNTFRYGFRVAVGYGHFNIFADYYASTLFKENKGPVLYPVNAGITLVGF